MPELYTSGNKNISQDAAPHNPLASFCLRPEKIKFETQEAQEKVILFLRQHPIVNIPWIVIVIVLFFAPRVLEFFPLLTFLPERFQQAALILWYLVLMAFALEKALAWFFNVYIITDERIIDVDFHNLIYKEVSDAKIDKIQEVKHTMGGVAGVMFNYGNIYIQTAGAQPSFDFESVPNPSGVTKILQELRTEEEIEAIEGRVR
ncbi:MAG: hypothetical protein A3D24_00635 [Candidatus Blackburnbacteria bacterium RIFCSPHIGHO2_02_FULL_39_13]|uniref:DUF304 domain-containing protein n=1 Tax=Candidatus Blackburnbacteria bacterium RIFCSPLOWO2_01_FULL_40_20 TaxID=1797519 RepID=A0A1G1VFU4_9BACT|nr:MAG: putative membrane protein [Microgenomates group bacterium GW2011_GWA2_39_19]OGY07581.1 MAG: hypothetical protein A2694_04985 [Candidatus Blackburnbacteria bacterium RIFCSPHIGHO2_01_FULL_40_17]OGY08664.1 MAG: hypothetical protein A3D24_00635 [Candidatus Blackburnbacteria bacterium RIFCSPHIGHO2_02_FULL_39_13]OGY14298.1 MAG: hypothetical protein A3A77_02380 [Candidatus Blackburnbacteria bacterium RIFCSPLOWO2_01_FULL_40_20]HBL51960.1 hypothetical protein [Candidatus Blackburnbacteria bacter